MLKEIKCLFCANVFFRIGPLDDKGEAWGIYALDREKYENAHKKQGDKEYYECLACHKKNWIASASEPGKGLKSWISHVTE